jgi:3-dehydroquinate synthase
VPSEYSRAIAEKCKFPVIVTVDAGEGSKSLATFERILTVMQENNFTRTDAVVAVGGGVVGDLGGFCAACYQRGVDFYNVPTTLLSQVDSSIGGKTAVNLGGVKNSVGVFYQPKCVLIDPDTLLTLDKRQFASGLAESVKMAACCDSELFEMLEDCDVQEKIDEIIYRSLLIKKYVVENDERENGLRRVLNFGHTVGHGIESCAGLSELLHGECVALGMTYMCSDAVKARLIPLLERLGLKTRHKLDLERVIEAMSHDKKRTSDKIRYIYVNEIGSFFEITEDFSRLADILREKNSI